MRLFHLLPFFIPLCMPSQALSLALFSKSCLSHMNARPPVQRRLASINPANSGGRKTTIRITTMLAQHHKLLWCNGGKVTVM